MLANLLQDVRYALHGFASRPMFGAVVRRNVQTDWLFMTLARVDPVVALRAE